MIAHIGIRQNILVFITCGLLFGCGDVKKSLYLEKAKVIETECKTLQDVVFHLGVEPGYHATTKVAYFVPRDVALSRLNGWGEIATWVGDDCCVSVRHIDGQVNKVWITLPDRQ